ncbi:lysozyme (plasmid) [Enterobacter bugandensis]|uniref:lysozyme n=1 Tax=Enterobacter bugandensis TaxID=881260 RepID=UPI00283AB475|nr:lysozyme [Enterobacter bugandensis]WMU75450.1 lysozyme [Enterobacter bugandensis]
MSTKSKAVICSVAAILGIAFGLPEFKNTRLSREGYALVAQAEGCRREAYKCSAGVQTTGIGHTASVRPASSLSDPQIARLFIHDINIAEKNVNRCIHVPLTQFQYDAFVSLAFNIGGRAFCHSTLVREANAGNPGKACQELSRWVFADGKRNAGLAARRQREVLHCLKEK